MCVLLLLLLQAMTWDPEKPGLMHGGTSANNLQLNKVKEQVGLKRSCEGVHAPPLAATADVPWFIS